MPRYGRRRKKRRTHVVEAADEGNSSQKVPRSFIFKRGKVSESAQQLVQNLRRVLLPYTALNLRETSRNTLKDFVSVAGPLGVTHFMMLQQSELGTTLRMARVPHGPTLTFKIAEFSLMRDIARMQRRPASLTSEFRDPPLVVLNGFSGAPHKQITAALLQGLVPPLDLEKLQLSQCRRVLLFNYVGKAENEAEDKAEDNAEDSSQGNADDWRNMCDRIEMRHYLVTASPVGINKNVKKIVKAKLPNLSKYKDIADYVEREAGAMTSDSEVEDDEENRLELPDKFGAAKGNRVKQTSAVRLKEVGPRVSLRLLKIEEGLGDGRVLYHSLVKKSTAEAAALERRKLQERELRAERRAKHEAARDAKLEKKRQKKLRRKQRQQERQQQLAAENEAALDEELRQRALLKQPTGTPDADADFSASDYSDDDDFSSDDSDNEI
ncbi:MAG: hypothetical protein MHM6MM_005323 [Cercozoa sp. M6MM]